MKNILKIEELKKVYGKKNNKYIALKGIDLEINEGEFVGVMGPSGSGKSTLLNIISTIDKPSNGKIYINGFDITNISSKKLATFRRENLGFIFQDFNLLDTLTVRENIALPLTLTKGSGKEINKKIMETSERLGIKEFLDKYPYEISGGQKQRTAACRAIITKPSLILADEPTGALDSKSAESLLNTIKDLNEINKATIMIVTHDAFTASYCKRVIFIKDGSMYDEIYREGTKEEFFKILLNTVSKMGN
ncbi:MAG: ABC transporter ATP-binding protein [Clostridium sp.]|uniref:ABC transporter ATP-binding protein n=1 Tax=Clostridium sp. TaxID=1506 RepID=UPI003F37257E